MGFNISSEYNSTTNQLMNLLGQIDSMGSSSAGSFGIGSIFTIQNNIEQVKSNDPQTKVNGIMNLAQQAMSLINKIANLQAAAKDRVNKDSKKANNLVEDTEKTKAELNQSMFDIGEEIDAQSDIVKDATAQMEKAQEDLNKTQEQIKEIIKQIEEKQAELANTTDPEKQKALLDEIYGLGMSITELTASTANIQEAFDTASETIIEAVDNIETAKGNSVEIQTEGQQQIVKGVQDATQATSETAATQVSGATDIATGEAIVASGTAASLIPGAGAVISTTAAQKGQELIAAGTTKTTGSVGNLQKIAQGIGGLQNNTTLLSTFENAIGGALKSFDDMVGGWNNVVTPLITSLGTLGIEGAYATETYSLVETVLADKETIAEYQEQNPSTQNQAGKTNTDTTGLTSSNENDKKAYELQTPKFSFGI